MSKPSLIDLKPTTVSGIREVAPGAFVLSFLRSFDFEPGHVIGMGLQPGDDARIYSLASGNKEEMVDILFDVKPGGWLTPKLAELQQGGTIYISEPFGSFLGSEKPAWWIAAGTGIAPYRSMLRSGLGRNKWVVHGSRLTSNFYFSDEFSELFGHHYIRCISGEERHSVKHDPGYFPGRVTDFLSTFDILEKDMEYYLCGSAEMVIDCRELLLSKKIPYGNILAEVYF